MATLPESDRHRLLSASRRRIALDVLAGRSPPVELADVAAAVAAREGDADEFGGPAAEQVAVTLHHNHLPKMAELGVIEYDPASRWVTSIGDEVPI